MASQADGAVSAFQGFSFAHQGVTLQPGRPYTINLVWLGGGRSGFARCGDIYPDGVMYWLGYSPEAIFDVSFRLYGP
jgi:hypothetical protein